MRGVAFARRAEAAVPFAGTSLRAPPPSLPDGSFSARSTVVAGAARGRATSARACLDGFLATDPAVDALAAGALTAEVFLALTAEVFLAGAAWVVFLAGAAWVVFLAGAAWVVFLAGAALLTPASGVAAFLAVTCLAVVLVGLAFFAGAGLVDCLVPAARFEAAGAFLEGALAAGALLAAALAAGAFLAGALAAAARRGEPVAFFRA
ncbi:MAG: hypothetical protein M0020_07975 [Actinomycetota bacterium]|nr:hypothetical protein [Actinomycetota bacterium]